MRGSTPVPRDRVLTGITRDTLEDQAPRCLSRNSYRLAHTVPDSLEVVTALLLRINAIALCLKIGSRSSDVDVLLRIWRIELLIQRFKLGFRRSVKNKHRLVDLFIVNTPRKQHSLHTDEYPAHHVDKCKS